MDASGPSLARFGPAEHELKYEVGRCRLEAVATHLAAFCRPDSLYPENIVVSLYYDTRDHRLAGEKLDSDYIKTKVRLRWYESATAPPTAAFLEVKRRIGSRRRKARIETGWDGPALRRSLIGRGPRVADALRRAGIAFGAELEPLLVVSYRRRRFVEPISGLRVCLDSDVRPSRPGRPAAPPLAAGVMEVKGASAQLPAALTHLVHAGCLPASFSKYGHCYLQLHGG